MKLAVTIILAALLSLDLVAAEEEQGDAPQCTSVNADGTCSDPSLPGDDDEQQQQNESEQEQQDEDSSLYPPTCGLYMAKSSIPNAGWGMYAARDFSAGDDILPLDAVVQVYDAPYRVREGRKSWILSEYVWNAGE